MKSLKHKSIFLLILTIVSLVITPVNQVVTATTLEPPTQKTEKIKIEQEIELVKTTNELVQPHAVSGTVVFFGGMAVAWVVDGVITYYSGKAPSEWVALGIGAIESRIRSLSKNKFPNIHVSLNGQVSGCIVFPCML